MRRRSFTEEQTSRLAIWARRIALFSLAATFIAIVIVRSGALDIVPALVDAGRRAGPGLRRHPAGAGRRYFDLARRRFRQPRSGDGLVHWLRADRLSALSRRQGAAPAGDLRYYHRPDRPAAIRRHRPLAAARRQSRHLCRSLCRRAAAQRLFRYRARRHQFDPAGSLRRGDESHYQAQMARGRCALAAGAAGWTDAAQHRGAGFDRARRHYRGGGAHADPRLPRRRRGARPSDRRTARASTCARPRATAATISAPMRRGCAI